jgi:Na+/H+ antiporter NhaD/arsenite permease-like protein
MADFSYIPVIALGIVFVLIITRKVGGFKVKIWQAMLLGAVIVVATSQISIAEALASINLDVMLFLFGMFVVGVAMEKSGYLANVSRYFFGQARSVTQLVFLLLFVMGMLSALLMNDTLAIVGTPVVLGLAKRHHISPKLLLITLAFAVTTGSVLSPIGNPQNLLVATQSGLQSPFVTFLQYLLVPTVINLLLAFVFLRIYYRSEFHGLGVTSEETISNDSRLVNLSKLSLVLVLSLILVKVVLIFLLPSFEFRLTYIAIIACLPILILSNRRTEIIRSIDWATLVFFAAMFILMTSVWDSGVMQTLLEDYNGVISTVPVVLVLSILLSQVLSNVPLVALYLPLLTEASSGIVSYVALAAGSTIAGNMLILGAASNVIIIQKAEKNGESLTFWEFARIGIPLTALQALVFVVFLVL